MAPASRSSLSPETARLLRRPPD